MEEISNHIDGSEIYRHVSQKIKNTLAYVVTKIQENIGLIPRIEFDESKILLKYYAIQFDSDVYIADENFLMPKYDNELIDRLIKLYNAAKSENNITTIKGFDHEFIHKKPLPNFYISLVSDSETNDIYCTCKIYQYIRPISYTCDAYSILYSETFKYTLEEYSGILEIEMALQNVLVKRVNSGYQTAISVKKIELLDETNIFSVMMCLSDICLVYKQICNYNLNYNKFYTKLVEYFYINGHDDIVVFDNNVNIIINYLEKSLIVHVLENEKTFPMEMYKEVILQIANILTSLGINVDEKLKKIPFNGDNTKSARFI